jgi:hypothetical protein
VTIEQIASDFGVHPMTLTKWMRQADIDDGARPGKTTASQPSYASYGAEPAAGAGQRGPASSGGVSVAVQPAGKRLYPIVKELAADGIPVAVTCRVLKLARQPYYRWLANPSPTPSWPRPTGPTPCSTPTATTRSSATGSRSPRPAIELAERIANYAPADLNCVFFTTGGARGDQDTRPRCGRDDHVIHCGT